MRWTVHGERSLYDSEWVGLRLVDVELPDGPRFDHHVVTIPREAAMAIVRDEARGVLMLWRHRFTVDSWGWELPAGAIDDGETPEQAALRETLEETGWQPASARPLFTFFPLVGTVRQRFHVLAADGAEHVGEPRDRFEAERVDWVPLERVPELIRAGDVSDGYSLTALLWMLAAI